MLLQNQSKPYIPRYRRPAGPALHPSTRTPRMEKPQPRRAAGMERPGQVSKIQTPTIQHLNPYQRIQPVHVSLPRPGLHRRRTHPHTSTTPNLPGHAPGILIYGHHKQHRPAAILPHHHWPHPRQPQDHRQDPAHRPRPEQP